MRTASMLFAQTLSRKCEGDHECHWCGAPCTRQWIHDDPPPLPFHRTRSSALRPGSPYVCVGCWHYRRPSVTAFFLGGGLKDKQSWTRLSWLLTPAAMLAVRPEDHQKLYAFLLAPEPVFALSLVTKDRDGSPGQNLIQLARVNEVKEVAGDTRLSYTLDGREYHYSPYELEESLRHGTDGKPGGVFNLLHHLGPCEQVPPHQEPEERGPGRPKKEVRARMPGKKIE